MRSIPFGKPMIGRAEKLAIMEVLDNPMLVHGPKTAEFESDFAAFTGAPAAVSVSSCTAGMHLVWFDLKVEPGDEIIVPAQTHTATGHAVEFTGARPVFVDAEPNTGNLDLQAMEAAIGENTKGICVVHYLGNPVDMHRVMAVARRHKLFVLEDCALAVGTRLSNIHAGLLGDAGSFSFYPVKHITTAEGGMVITRDEGLAARLTRKKAFGVDQFVGQRKQPGMYDVSMLGFNYRMNEIQAALGVAQLKRVETFLEQRENNYQTLTQSLHDMDEIRCFTHTPPAGQSSRYCLTVMLKGKWRDRRAEVIEKLKGLGVGCSVYYPHPVPLMGYYREKYGYRTGQFPVAEAISNQSIALPVGPHLTEADMRYIAQTLRKIFMEDKI